MEKILHNSVRFNFLYVDAYCFGSAWAYPENVQPYNMLRYILSGRALFYIDGKKMEVTEDSIIYIPQGCRLSCRALSGAFQFISIRFTTSVFFDGSDFLSDYYGIPSVMKNKNEKIYFEKIYYWVKTVSPARMFWVRGYLELLIASIIENNPIRKGFGVPYTGKNSDEAETMRRRTREKMRSVDTRIQAVIDHIILYPLETYSAAKLADMAHLSCSRFRTLFKEQTGKTPLIYLKEIRVTLAARRLLVSNEQIGEIAYSLGFDDVNYFIRMFKSVFGVTPRQYRERAKE